MFAETEFTTGTLSAVARPETLDFLASYNVDLFRGRVDTAETAARILKALRSGTPDRHSLPQVVLSASAESDLRCDTLHADG